MKLVDDGDDGEGVRMRIGGCLRFEQEERGDR